MMLFNFLQSINSILIIRVILKFSFKNFSVTMQKEKTVLTWLQYTDSWFMVLPIEKSVLHLKGSFSCNTLPISSLLSIRHKPSRMTRKDKAELQTCPHGSGKGKGRIRSCDMSRIYLGDFSTWSHCRYNDAKLRIQERIARKGIK